MIWIIIAHYLIKTEIVSLSRVQLIEANTRNVYRRLSKATLVLTLLVSNGANIADYAASLVK
jgi:hypothetical protein